MISAAGENHFDSASCSTMVAASLMLKWMDRFTVRLNSASWWLGVADVMVCMTVKGSTFWLLTYASLYDIQGVRIIHDNIHVYPPSCVVIIKLPINMTCLCEIKHLVSGISQDVHLSMYRDVASLCFGPRAVLIGVTHWQGKILLYIKWWPSSNSWRAKTLSWQQSLRITFPLFFFFFSLSTLPVFFVFNYELFILFILLYLIYFDVRLLFKLFNIANCFV